MRRLGIGIGLGFVGPVFGAYVKAPLNTLLANTGFFTLTGNVANLVRSRIMPAAAGVFTISGQSAGLTVQRTLTAASGSFAVTGNDVALTKSSVGAYTLTAAAGSFAITGDTMTPVVDYILPADSGSFSIAGQAVGMIVARILPVAAGSFAITGQAAGLALGHVLPAAAGAFTIGGQAVTLTYSGGVAPRVLTAAVGSFAITGQASNLVRSRNMPAAAGSFTIGGQAVTLTYSGAGGGDAAWTTAFLARTSGLDTGHTNIVKAMMNSMATNGLDAKCDVAWLTALPGTNGNLNLKSSSYTLTNHGATHTDDLGYTGDGAAAWVDTGFAPVTNSVVATPTSAAWVFVQPLTADFDNNSTMAIANASFADHLTAADFGSELSGHFFGVGFAYSVSDPVGMSTISLTSATVLTAYKNFSQAGTNTSVTGKDAAFTSGNLTLCGNASTGFSVGPVSFAAQFSGLTAGDVSNLFTALYTALHALNPTAYP